MFGKATRGKRLKSADRIPGSLPFVTAGENNAGISAMIGNHVTVFPANTITIDMFGSAKYRGYQYGADDHVAVIHTDHLPANAVIFLTAAIHKSSHNGQFDYSRNFYASDADDLTIQLPITPEGRPDYDFMASFIAELEAERIAELEAYLKATGLKDYHLTPEERATLEQLEQVQWGAFRLGELFENVRQGKRLKKNDQIKGNIPFVMAGTTNMGIANFISNPVIVFPENSITIDILGNAFYRNYSFGASDDVGVYWNSKKRHSAHTMLFISAAINKSLQGIFDYGRKLRSSKSLNYEVQLPITPEGKPDYDFMERFVQALQKVVIADVVKYADRKIEAHKTIIESKAPS